MRHAFNDQPHFAFENVDDLFLWMRVRWHLTIRRESGEHLIHRFAVCNRPARDSGTNFNRGAFWFHIENISGQLKSREWSPVRSWHLSHASHGWQYPTMKTFTSLITIVFAALIVAPSFAQSPAPALATSPARATGAVTAPVGQPNPQEMMKQMMEMSKLNENHKLLADMDGNWNYAIKMWMNPDPNAKPQESKGTATRKSIMGGRYVVMDVTGKMQMPDQTGKMKDMQFKGMGVEGYDNMKKKFVSSWIDNMGTGIQFSDGTYDPATKTLTYTSEMEMMPGMKTPVREVLKLTDKDHMQLEWYETHGGQEKKTMEIAYTRAGKK